MIDNRVTAAVGKPLRTDYKVHQLFSKETGEPTTQDTFVDINTGEVGDNRGDNPEYNHNHNSFRNCEVNTLVNVAIMARIAMLGNNLLFFYLKTRFCKYH